MGEAFDTAWAVLKALNEQQVLDTANQPVKTMHPAIVGMMERRELLRPQGQRVMNPIRLHPGGPYPQGLQQGHLEGGWSDTMRPQFDMSRNFPYFPDELDEGYATPEEYEAASEDLRFGREPRFKPTVPGY
tara:strand:+ start:299 stop:691 length:393 start_codon:yes stop_codon:yes gene_type:complete